MAALFMPFSTTKPNGLGLGLVICREIAVELGGELRVESSPRGATFTLVLKSPVPENSSAGIAKPGRVSARGRGAKVV
jgi:two-component system C4-dicarboxylate transport sensor histidine kinase DctB